MLRSCQRGRIECPPPTAVPEVHLTCGMCSVFASQYCEAHCLDTPPTRGACDGTPCVIDAAARGDTSAWDLVARKLYTHIRRQARSVCRNPDAAEDLAQDAMLRAVQTLGQLRIRRGLLAWSWQVVRNAHRMSRRQSKFAPVMIVPLHELQIPPRKPADALDLAIAEQTAQRVEAAIAALPEILRHTVELRLDVNSTTNQTARVLGISRDAVRTRLNRARHVIRAALCDSVPGNR